MATRFLRPPAFFLRLLPLVLLTGVAQALSRTEMQVEAMRMVVEKEDSGIMEGIGAEEEYDDRYVGHCISSVQYMWPGRSRKFWSYGYVSLQEPYPANCTLSYTFNIKLNPDDTMERYGFRVTGTFQGPNVLYDDCSETDYVFLDDGDDNNATYCGTSAVIDFITGSDYLEFHFISQENSLRAKGFYVTIESIYLCGGTYTHLSHGPSGYLTSPLHAALYPPNAACSWYFSTTGETTIVLHCSAFHLEDQTTEGSDTYCPDSLSVTTEVGSDSATTSFCSSELAEDDRYVYSRGNYMLLSFVSNSDTHYSGFNCTYEFILYAV